jgi:hypothetical protein
MFSTKKETINDLWPPLIYSQQKTHFQSLFMVLKDNNRNFLRGYGAA